MTLAAHFLTGAAICQHVRRRPVGLLLAFLSHLVFDAVPHFEDHTILGWDSWTPVEVVSHVLVAGAAIAILWRSRGGGTAGRWAAAYLIGGGVAACLPDIGRWLCGRHSLLGEINAWAHWWGPTWRELRKDPTWRVVGPVAMSAVEVAVAAIAAWLLFRRRPVGPADPMGDPAR